MQPKWGFAAAAGAVTAVVLLAAVSVASAQQAVVSAPLPATSANGDASGTVAVTGTFQKVFGGAGNTIAPPPGTPGERHGCSVQNNGTHTMYVTEGTGVVGSSLTNSWQVAVAQLFNCNFGGVVLTGEIDLTGTAGDAFVAKQY